MAEKFLESRGFEPYECASEDEARDRVSELKVQKKWPCYFFQTDTTGEKDFEEFYTESEEVEWERYHEIGVVKNEAMVEGAQLEQFCSRIQELRRHQTWTKQDLLESFGLLLSGFAHRETGKYLDNRM